MRSTLDLADDRETLSRMAGLELKGADLPVQGFGHVFLGGPGPILAYRIGPESVRLCLDVPLTAANDASSLKPVAPISRAGLSSTGAPSTPRRSRVVSFESTI